MWTWLRKENFQRETNDKIRKLVEKETYKYFGILEADNIKQVEMKEKITKEYRWRTLSVSLSLLIAIQNKTIRPNYIKSRIDKLQQNSKCRLCGDRDETINHIISEFSKLAQKE